ncbi:PREDICTED: protein DBF4 homolog A [Nanorana parkeri]|uniref:protein DBF4 homolog A n=1 Tax=Nanorana parkeri TaxID=125878 RepID=UPI000854E436|nr:PREDICTED: protein DBF4 homolog A [Nanorana parkeri]
MQRSKGGTQGRGVKLKPVLPTVKRPPEKGPTEKPLTGRVFYLDIPSKLICEKLEKDIKELGGTVEGFLSKEISYLITSKKEAKCTKPLKYSCSLSSPEPAQNAESSSARPGSHRGGIQEGGSSKKPEKDDVSRGKSLLKKVIKGQEILQKNSILANAWNWGVRILHVDEAKIYIEQKKRLFQQAKQPEAASKPVVKQPVRRKAKAQKLKSPYIKVEDSSCQYRPLYLVLPCFRSFQSPPSKPCQSVEKKAATANKATETKQGLNKTWHGQDGGNNSQCKMREQKKRGYCECCLQKYDDLEAHLVSQPHKNFSQGPYYQDVDNLISMFDFDFVDWSIYRQDARSSAMLMPTVTVKWEEKEITERHLQSYQKISSSVKQTPETIQRTESEAPLAAAADGLVNNHIQSPEPMESSICPVQTVDNASATDSGDIPPGTPAFLPITDNSPIPAGEPITVCDQDCMQTTTHSLEHTPRRLTFGLSVVATAIQKCSPEHGEGCPSKKIKLDGSLVSGTLYSEPVDADHVTSPKPVMDTVPGVLETTGLSNHSGAFRDQSPPSSPSKLQRKVKQSVRKPRKQEDLHVTPVCKVSVPVEESEWSSSRERLLSIFETSEVQSEFCGFSYKSENLPRGVNLKKESPSSGGDFHWCLFSTTSSSAETFHGF